MKDTTLGIISLLSAIVSLVVGIGEIASKPILGAILLVAGVAASSYFGFLYVKSNKLPYQLRVLYHEVTVDMRDPDGNKAAHSRKTRFKCLADEVTSFTDHMSADGEFKNLTVTPGVIESIRREGGDLFVVSSFGRVLYKDDEIERTISAMLIDSFHNQPEYWSVRIILPTDKFTLRIIFHKDRPYKNVTGYRRITSHEQIAKTQPRQVILDGCPALEWEVEDPKVKDVYKLQWEW